MKRIAFKTFGCRANTNDTDALYHEAIQRGFLVVPDTQSADAYVINTCTVTENADRDARQQALKFKRQNQGALVAMVGCYAQVAADQIEALPQVDVVVGTANKFRVLDHFATYWNGEVVRKNQVEPAKGFLPEQFPGSRYSRANVKIQDGCNYKCSFCIIPQARGRSRSLPLDVVSKQVKQAYAEGFNEVVLTGIHLAHYGWDQQTDLTTLLKTLLAEPQGPRIRVSTLDPFEIPDEVIAMLGNEERLCPHFHIALQSGSDGILKSMKRLYKAEEFISTNEKIRRQNPDTFIGVDVIVGFPGEGEKEFKETLHVLENSYWTKLHVFSFSPRVGTVAADMHDSVSKDQIALRSETLRLASEVRYHQFLDTQKGKIRPVLIERESKKEPGLWLGHTDNYLPTLSRMEADRTKEIMPSLLEGREGDRMRARACHKIT